MATGSSNNNNNKNNSSGQDRDLEQPLLRSSTPTPKPPPRHAFVLSPNQRDEGDHHEPASSDERPHQQQQQQQPPYEASTSDLTDVQDVDEQFTMLPVMMGRPFATSAKFWYQLLPGSLLIGALSGFSVAAFSWTTQKCISQWPSAFEKHDDANPQSLFQHVHGSSSLWSLLLVCMTSMGGLVSGLCFLLPKTPRLGACKTFLHNAVDLQANPPWEESLLVIFSSLVLLATGGPLGPELAIGAIGSGLASLVGRIVGNVDPKTFALWVQAGLSGSLGSFFSSPLLGILLMHELGGGRGGLTTMSCRRRPLTTSIDGTTNNRENEQSLIPFKGDSFLERMVTSGASAIMTSLVLNYIFQGVYWQNNNGSLENDDFEAWHWALAIPMGLLGGLVASMVLATTCACRTIRIRVSESFQLPYWGQVLLFCTLGGLFHGLLGCYRSPMTDFGISFLTNAMNSMQSDDSVTSPVSFLVMALVQGLRVSICIGFGLVGGMFVPMAFVGACIGLAVTSSIFPLSLAVPCCMASCVGALCPTPLTIVMATSLLFHLTGEQMTSVWIATMVAQTLVGGFGILPRRLGIQMVCLLESEQELQRLHLQDTEDNDDMYMQQPSLSDDAIVRGVRSAIFGPASS